MKTTKKEVTLYHCGYCHDKFRDEEECARHEQEHDKIKSFMNRRVVWSETDSSGEILNSRKGKAVGINLPDFGVLVETLDGERRWVYVYRGSVNIIELEDK